jgi:hypothetical protein
MFRKLDLFPHLEEGKGTPTLLGLLERGYLQSLDNPIGTIDKIHKYSSSVCSEPFRFYLEEKLYFSLHFKHYEMHKTNKYTFVREITSR